MIFNQYGTAYRLEVADNSGGTALYLYELEILEDGSVTVHLAEEGVPFEVFEFMYRQAKNVQDRVRADRAGLVRDEDCRF